MDVLRVELQKGAEQLLLVCSDGVWEFITSQEVGRDGGKFC